jgi:putative ATP-binding cassette transporter
MLFVILGSVAFFGNALAPPEVIALFIILATYCIGAFNTVLQGVQQLSAARNSMRKIDSLALAPESAIAQAPTPGDAALPTDWRTLSVQGLHYRYPSQDGAEGFAIGPVSVSIGRGELVFVSGGNGSGKSTFMSVLVGLLTPQEGMVQLDGRSVLGEQLASFQNMLGVIHSDFYLFDQVLNANDGSASAEDARRWLGLLELDGIVSVHDGMFSTTKLSRGQRKRLALVAALTADKDIYVLDEWAADQDPYFRDVFYNVVLQQLRARGKTVIAVSHDDRYYHVPDRVLRVDGGRIEDVSAAHAIAEPA